MTSPAKDVIAQAVVDTYADIEERHQVAPSRAVQLGAMSVIGRGQITIRRALTYDVPSESEPGVVHVVALYLWLSRDRATEGTWANVAAIRARPRVHPAAALAQRGHRRTVLVPEPRSPARPAGYRRTPVCRHLLASLALARLQGYRLETPRS